MIRVSVIGATGYTGAELLRLLSRHPEAEVVSAASRTFAGKGLKEIYSSFQQAKEISLMNPEELSDQQTDLVFLCLPHGESMKAVPKLLEAGVRVIDLSADFRYRSTKLYEEWYARPHTAKDANEKAVYGLPEFRAGEVQTARLVANPGCYATAAVLALVPLLKRGLIRSEGIVVNGASGVTGAGRRSELEYSFCEVSDDYRAYAPVRHRHTSEIEEQIQDLSGSGEVTLLFTPHLLPVKRGILETIYADLAPGTDEAAICRAYEEDYGATPFTSYLPNGVLPELKSVVGSNNCLIGSAISERTNKAIIFSSLDNLIKGAAGQAVQNMNLMFGLPEDTGLPLVANYL